MKISLNNIPNTITYKKNFISFVIIGFLIFFTIFRITIPGIPPQITSTRISILFLFIISIIKNGGILNKYNNCLEINKVSKVYLLMLPISILGLILDGSNSSYVFWKDIVEFVLFYVILFYSLINLLDDNEQFFKILTFVCSVQSIIIFIGVINTPFRLSINTAFNSLSYWNVQRDAEEMFKYGYAYGIGCMTSTGSIRLALGQLGCVYLISRKNGFKSVYWAIFSLITISSIMVSRTGMLFAVVCVVFLLFQTINNHSFFKVSISAFIILLVIFWFFSQSGYKDAIIGRFSRLNYLLEHGLYESYFYVYSDAEITKLPSLLTNLIFGTGITSGITYSGIEVYTDSGFLKTYSAIGLFSALILYVSIFIIFIKDIRKSILNKKNVFVTICFVLVLLIGELKEQVLMTDVVSLYFVYIYMENFELRMVNNEKI